MAIEQPLQLDQRPAWALIRPEAKPAQAGSTGGMVDQPDRGHWSGPGQRSSCLPTDLAQHNRSGRQLSGLAFEQPGMITLFMGLSSRVALP